jgi:hypothetical protein
MSKKPKWQKPLTKTEIRHLKEMGVTTLKAARKNFAHQKKMRSSAPEPMLEPCWDCRHIAKKMGEPI